ncbi:hypothetical protein V8D89_001228 [Ganoderma adspersum]
MTDGHASPCVASVILAAMESLFILALLTLTISIVLSIRCSRRGKTRDPLPPGPRPLPIIGNVLDIPRNNVWERFSDLGRKYGGIMYLNALGQKMLVLSSVETTFDLLDKKSANCSDRPTTIVMQLLGLDLLFTFMQYGREWRQHRRAFSRSFALDRVAHYESVQANSARRFLGRLLNSPDCLSEHLNRLVSDTALRTVYGIDMHSSRNNTELYGLVERLSRLADLVVLPQSYILELFPSLRYVPSWFPGMGIKRAALEGRRIFHATLEALDAKAMSVSESDGEKFKDCLVSQILNHDDTGARADVRKMCQHVAASAYTAGTDTIHALLQAFFLAMAMHPETQRKAHEELDAVVGMDRLPDLSDRDALSYTRAVLKEVMRWHIILPMGVPHVTMADDEYNGFFIPAGTMINPNIWAMSRNPDEYPDPECFRPERFLRDNPPRDPADYVFGFGRRICPGRHFSMASAFIYVASILHVFDIQPPLDEHGLPVKLEYKTTGAVVSHIHGYQYIIKPRSQQVERLASEHVEAD